jgi:hypothetical protein
MKTFKEFVSLVCFVLSEEKKEGGRSGPKYNYEVALVNLYNYLIKGEDKTNNKGKILRGAVSRGDTDTVVDILADELKQAKNNENHPLHFNNASDEGFSGKKKTDAHRNVYYQELEDQFYTFLNDSQSRVGKSLISQGYVAKRLGETKIPLSKTGQKAYGKESDTSKADIVFQHPTRPERVNYSSLKKASGAVSASAGAEETAGNYTVGMKSALKLALKSGRITKDQAKELEAEGSSKISTLKDAMLSSKGMSKEQQKDLLPELDRLRGEVEKIIPGTERETAKEQLSGEGKYGRGIDSFLSTGRGGARKTKPEEVSGTNQRMRVGKGQTKPASGPREQRPVTSTGDIKPPVTGEPSTFSDFSKKISSTPQEKDSANLSQAHQALADAERERADAEVVRFPNGKPVPRKNQFYLQNNPDAAQQHSAKQQIASQAVQDAQVTVTNIQSRSTQATKKPEQPEQPEQPQLQKPTQPQQQSTQSTQSTQPQQTTQTQPVKSSVPQPVASPEDEQQKRKRETRERMSAVGQRLGVK